jgi:hypothetical protein
VKKVILTGICSIVLFSLIVISFLTQGLSGHNNSNARAAGNLPPLPSQWPYPTLQLGMVAEPGDGAQIKATAPVGFMYHYLTSGSDTCQWCPWLTWGTSDGTTKSGAYVKNFITDANQNNITPFFTYYNMLSLASYNEGAGEVQVMSDSTKMTSYYNDLKLFYSLAAQSPNKPIILHVEPDLWGYMEQQVSSTDEATTIPAAVASTGLAELSGLPNNAAGFAQAVVKLRDIYAPNVLVVLHESDWGTGIDPHVGTYTDAEITSLATRSANFFNSLNANYDLLADDPLDRDAAYYDLAWHNPNGWWDSNDYHYDLLWLKTLSGLTNKRLMQWQIPVGNTKMRAENNTTNHYQDNHVEKILDVNDKTLINQYLDAGVVAFIFGRGAYEQSDYADSINDGATNFAPLTYHGSTTSISSVLAAAGTPPSLSVDGVTLTTPYAKDDDGGFFRYVAQQYYQLGALSLSTDTGTPTPTPTTTPTPTPTTTPTPALTPDAKILSFRIAKKTANSITIQGTTQGPSKWTIKYGKTTGMTGGQVTESVVGTTHTVMINNLSRYTKYYYQITSNGADGSTVTSSRLSFRTNLR